MHGLICTLRAPIDVLAAGLIGLGNADQWLGGDRIWCWASAADRCLDLGIAKPTPATSARRLGVDSGRLGLTYSVRNLFGPHWLMEVQRYHLFPQLGFVLVLVGVFRAWLRGSIFGRDPHFCLQRSWPPYFWQPINR